MFAVSAVLIVALIVYRRKRGLHRFLGRGPAFWGAAGIGGVLCVVGALAAADFDRAFTVFHSVFFPGKDNWIFDQRTDPIIRLMPEEFFRNCAILILALLILAAAVIMLADLRKKK